MTHLSLTARARTAAVIGSAALAVFTSGAIVGINRADVAEATLIAATPKMAEFTGPLDDFYKVPATVPAGAEGTVVRWQRIRTGDTNTPVEGNYRVMYKTTTTKVQGGTKTVLPIVATGMVVLPALGTAPPVGGYPTVAWTHGTTGMIAKCGPSRIQPTADVAPSWRSWMRNGGVRTVAPDYPGQGTTSGLGSSDQAYSYFDWDLGDLKTRKPFADTTHPYLSIEAEGRSTIDMVKAGRNLEILLAGRTTPDTRIGAGNQFVVVGSSQGGHAALATGELHAAGYGRDLDLKAIMAGAPASELSNPNWITSPFAKLVLPMIVVGQSVEYKDVRPAQFFTEEGRELYDELFDAKCMVPLEDVFKWAEPFLTDSVQGNTVDALARPEVQTALKANSPGYRAIRAPIFMAQGEGDPLSNPVNTRTLVNRLRTERGASVTFCAYPKETSYTGLPLEELSNHNHVLDRMYDAQGAACTNPQGATTSATSLVKWLEDLQIKGWIK